MARCVHEGTFKCPRLSYTASYLRVCLFIFILFLGVHISGSACFHHMRMSHGMPRFSSCHYRTFRMPRCFGRCRGIPSCVLSPPGPTWVLYTCDSSPYRALILPALYPHLAHCAAPYKRF
jgi:hypothetical protein